MAFFVLAELASFNGASESEQDEEHASTSSSSAADLDVIVIGVSNRSPSLCCRRLRSSVVVVSDVIVAVAIARLFGFLPWSCIFCSRRFGRRR